MESNTGINEDRHAEERNYVTDSTTRDVKRQIVDIITPVRHMEAQPTESPTATLPLGIEVTGRRPKYPQYHIWDPDGTVTETTAEWTE